MPTAHNNEEELHRLRELVVQLNAQHEAALANAQQMQGQIRLLTVERDLLKERLRASMRKLFAAKSEARGAAQSDLFFNEAEALATPTTAPAEQAPSEQIQVPAHRRIKPGRKPLDAALPREVIRHELPETERVCPHDGATLKEIGVETSEQLDIVPQQIRVIRHERVKYACPCCDGTIKLTPAPVRIIPKGLLTEAALAWVIVAKYVDGLPLYRQAALMGRFGGELSRNSLAWSVVRVGQALTPMINLLRDRLFESNLILGDETELQVLKEPGRTAQQRSYLWVQMSAGQGPPVRLFSYAPSRSTATALELYRGATKHAALLTDGYEPYEQLASQLELTHLGCWAHARRRFVEAEAALPKAARTQEQPATQFIAVIGQLYAIEEQARSMSAADRKANRQQHSKPVLDRIAALLQVHLHSTVPNSLLGQALHYLSGQWPKLMRFVEDGNYPIDNNACENAIRPFVIGRKNWLFSDTVNGAKASANLYSIVETAKANAVEPYRYLCELLRRLPQARTVEDYEALLPWRIELPIQ